MYRIGLKIREERKKAGFSQENLANAIDSDRTVVARWETGVNYPSIDSLKKVADALSITIDKLLPDDWLYNTAIKNLTGNKYQRLAARTINKALYPEQQAHHALHGMVGEIGELHSLYQKTYQGHTVSKDHLKKELGDLLWFIAEYSTAMGWPLEEVMALNIAKLKARYPEGFEAEKSLHRKEGDI